MYQLTKTQLTTIHIKYKDGNLSDKERQEIFAYYQTGHFTQDALANQYGVSQSTIHEIVSSQKA